MVNVLGIGAGYVGGPTMAVMADQCPDHHFTVVDVVAEKIERWNSTDLPIFEPGLDDLIQRVRGRNLFFSTDIEKGIAKADIIFVSVNTPTKTYGKGAGYAADLQFWEKTARQIKANATSSKIVVEKSTVPVRTAQAMERILNDNPNGIHFDVLSCPEFLAEGTAIRDLEKPDRVLIGGRPDRASGLEAMNTLVSLFAHWVPREKIVCSNVWSAELSKLTANAFLAQRVSSINAISELCEKTEADVGEVARAIGMDHRIGAKFLQASVGFGGSCFKKDVLNLVYLCRFYGLDQVADYWESVVTLNQHQMDRFVDRILTHLFNTVSGKKIALFGFAFKANTGDTRESPAIHVAKRLLTEKANVVVTDPKALGNAAKDLHGLPVTFETDPYKAAEGAHAIAVLTEWDCYRGLDYRRIYDQMSKPAFIFDGRNLLDHQALFQIGFHVIPIGKPNLSHYQKPHS